MKLISLLARVRPRRRRSQIAAAGGLLVVAVLVLGGIWTIRIAQRAQSLGQELRATAGAAQGAITSTDTTEIARLRTELSETAPRVRELQSDLWPLRLAGSIVGWYPVLGDNVTAAPKLASRLVDDVDAALAFVEAGERLVFMYESIPQEASGITAILNALPSEEQISIVTELILDADTALARSEKTSDTVHDGRLWGRLGREAREMRAQEAELRELIDWSLLATRSLSALAQLSDASEGLAAVIDSGDTADLDGSVLRQMPILEVAAERAFTTVSAAVDSAPESVASSAIGRNLADLRPILDALHSTARAGALVSQVITPAFEPIRSSNSGLFGPGSGLLDMIALIGERGGLLLEANDLLVTSRARLISALPDIKTPSAAGAADGLLKLSKELELSVGLLRELPELGPPALGVDGPRRYLVLAESADEIRPSGGLVSGAWVITFDRGELVTSVYHDVVEIDDLTNLVAYSSPPELLTIHMDASVWLLRDVGWSPHFPSVAQSAAEIVAIGQDGLEVDGVIALTQWALIGLADALGSIETDQGSIPSSELITVLEAGTDEEGRVFMNSVFQGLLDQISGPGINDRLFQLARAASIALNEKQTLVHMFDDDLQAIIERSGWDGGIREFSGDRIVPVDSNIGWSKVDRNIDRSLEYQVTLNSSDPSTAKATVGYLNRSGPDSSGCEAQSMNRGTSYSDLKNACYWNLLRLYTAKGASLISSDPLPLPQNSVFGRLGLGGTGDDTVTIGIGPEGTFVSGLLVVPAGQQRSATFNFRLPESIVNWDQDEPVYTLNLVAQPGSLGRDTKVRVTMPGGFEFVSSSTRPTDIVGQDVHFDFLLLEDTTLTVRMRKTAVSVATLHDSNPAGRSQ